MSTIGTAKIHDITKRDRAIAGMRRALQAMMLQGHIPRRKYLVRADVGDERVIMQLLDPDTEQLILTLSSGRDGQVEATYAH